MRTTAMLMRGSGSLNGIAAQVSFPSMSTSGLSGWRTPGPTERRASGTCRRLVQDALEQFWCHRAIGCGRYGFARLGQLGIAGIVESRPGAARLLDPSVESV